MKEVKMIPYRRICMEYGYSWEPINLTGKWSLDRRAGDHDYTMFLEYKGWFLKHWVHEDSIEIRPEPDCIIMECGE